jgi:hypothetical protein
VFHGVSSVVLAHLVGLVYLVCLVCLVEQDQLDELNKPNQPDKPNKPDQPDRPDRPDQPQPEARLSFAGLRGQESGGELGSGWKRAILHLIRAIHVRRTDSDAGLASGILILKNFASYATRRGEGETIGSNISDRRGFLFDVVHLLE